MSAILSLKNVSAGYRFSQVLHSVDLTIEEGRSVALLGRNGMGKTTSIRVIMGQLPLMSGEISRFGDTRANLAPHLIAQRGIGLVPEGRQIFTNLSVLENLVTFQRPSLGGKSRWDLQSVLALFPPLAARLKHSGSTLSGGEQQMLAIGRALMTNPRLLILDEATEGLAPLIRAEIWKCLRRIKEEGQSILVVDKNIADMVSICDGFSILEKGRTVWHGKGKELLADTNLQERYLGI